MDKIRNNAFVKKIGFNTVVLLVIMVLLYLMFVIVVPLLNSSTTFLSYDRISSLLNYAYFMGFLSLGVGFVIATGGIDFSIGPVMFCAALVGGYQLTSAGWPVPVCLFLCVLVGFICGAMNGTLVTYFGLPSFITSMAIMMIAKGVGSIFTKSQPVSWPDTSNENGWYRNLLSYNVGGVQIPTGFIILIAAAIICAIIFKKTKAGRYILCIGSNREAVRLSGVNTKKWEMLAYIICGTCTGIAAIFYVGAYTTVNPGLGDTFNNDAIASCVMGGTSMVGGVASVGGTIVGVLIISLLQVGILAMGLQINYQYVLTGIIVLVVVFADVRSRARKR